MFLGGLYESTIYWWIKHVCVCEDYAFLLRYGQYGDRCWLFEMRRVTITLRASCLRVIQSNWSFHVSFSTAIIILYHWNDCTLIAKLQLVWYFSAKLGSNNKQDQDRVCMLSKGITSIEIFKSIDIHLIVNDYLQNGEVEDFSLNRRSKFCASKLLCY